MVERRKPASLYELRVTVPGSLGDDVGAFLVQRGAGGVVEEKKGRAVCLVTYGEQSKLVRLANGVSAVLRARARTRVRPAPASLTGWDTAWMQALAPVRISRSLTLLPTNVALPTGASGSLVRLEPALAFGFGEHPTTRLAARAVERVCRGGRVGTVLDIGTGSGVLAVVAAVSGAARVVGIDIHAGAIRAAQRNAALNGVEGRCRFSATPLSRIRAHFDLVVANIDRRTILLRAKALRRAMAPGGTLLLAGFLAEDLRDIERGFRGLGLTPRGRRREADWVLVTLRETGN